MLWSIELHALCCKSTSDDISNFCMYSVNEYHFAYYSLCYLFHALDSIDIKTYVHWQP